MIKNKNITQNKPIMTSPYIIAVISYTFNNEIGLICKEDSRKFLDILNTKYNTFPNHLLTDKETVKKLNLEENNNLKIITNTDFTFDDKKTYIVFSMQSDELYEYYFDNIEYFVCSFASKTTSESNVVKCRIKPRLYNKISRCLTGFMYKKEDSSVYNGVISTENQIVEEDCPYTRILRKLYEESKAGTRETRNGKTISCFGELIRFDLSNNKFPIPKGKKVFFKACVLETQMFLKGETDTKEYLEKYGVNIWKKNTTEEFIKSRNLDLKEGNMGKMYGYQWRNFDSCGLDQLNRCIKLIKEDPNSRRILMTSYNPKQLEEGVLEPCHGIAIQFYVKNNTLSCMMTQRSADVFLGLPFNIVSYSLIVNYIAKTLDLKCGELIISLGDYHLYENHIDQALQQLLRPTILLKDATIHIKEKKDKIEDYGLSDIELKYFSYNTIKAEMNE